MKKIDSILGAIDNVAKSTEARFRLREAEIDKLQTDVSFQCKVSLQLGHTQLFF